MFFSEKITVPTCGEQKIEGISLAEQYWYKTHRDLVIWMIWCERNNRIFNNKEKTLNNVLQDIKDTASMWCVAGAKKMATLVAFSSRE
jgi:hypothetical protein